MSHNKKAAQKRWRDKSTEYRAEYQREWRRNNRSTINRYQNGWRHGMNKALYDELFNKQNGLCACCGTDTPGGNNAKSFCIDHDHRTDVIRGLLCHTCNAGIGFLGDTYEAVMRAAAYLKP